MFYEHKKCLLGHVIPNCLLENRLNKRQWKCFLKMFLYLVNRAILLEVKTCVQVHVYRTRVWVVISDISDEWSTLLLSLRGITSFSSCACPLFCRCALSIHSWAGLIENTDVKTQGLDDIYMGTQAIVSLVL